MANPSILRWLGPTTFTDGSPYTEADHAGFEVQIDKNGVPGIGAVAIPVGWSTNGSYEFPLATVVEGSGSYQVRMRTVSKNGNVSNWSSGVTFVIDDRVPNPPTSLQVA
jgi:hypothetical protein